MCRVLVVDDHAEIRELIGHLLRTRGHQAEEATNGREALEWLVAHRDEPPCLIILDMLMPVMDGWDFLEKFRQDPGWTGLPVILLSATFKDGAAPPVLKAQAFWPKPIDERQLERIHERCPVHHQSWPPPSGGSPTAN